ncbi:MAG: FAD-dependent oxidoreductase [Actinomycetota bacterium]|nr:FAD-dependent oxidoreductase [Actinomycetota bacterium]
MTSVLIVGGGLAAARCADTLRAGGFDGTVVLAGAESHAPYERPALSKELLSGARDAASLTLRDSASWSSADIALRLGSPVARIDLAGRRAFTRSGVTLSYDVLVVATGARPRRHPALSRLPGVHHLRTLDDATRLRDELLAGTRLAIVGAGLIGAEVASTVRALGIAPTLIEAAPTPLVRAFGREVGAHLAERWRCAGVAVRTGARIADARRDRLGRVNALALEDGASIACDHVLVSIGVVPATSLVADHLDLAPDGGIATDACGRTSAADVFACGDVASWHRHGIGSGLRAENWTSAAHQAAIVARTILGDEPPASDAPLYAWSDQFGLRLQHVSTGAAWQHVEIEYGAEDFEARYLDCAGHLVAALVANRPRAIAGLRRHLAAPAVAA